MTHRPRISIELCEDHDAQLNAGRPVVFHLRRCDVQVRRRRPWQGFMGLSGEEEFRALLQADDETRYDYIQKYVHHHLEITPDWTVDLAPGFGGHTDVVSEDDAREMIEILKQAEEAPEWQASAALFRETREGLAQFIEEAAGRARSSPRTGAIARWRLAPPRP